MDNGDLPEEIPEAMRIAALERFHVTSVTKCPLFIYEGSAFELRRGLLFYTPRRKTFQKMSLQQEEED